MSKYIVNGSSALDEVVLNKFVVGDTESLGYYACLTYRITYSGSWAVDTTFGSKRSAADITAVWNAGDNRLDVGFSGLLKNFTDKPAAVVSAEAAAAHATGASYHPQVRVTSTTAALVRWVDAASGALITTEHAKMSFYLTLYGAID